MSKEPRGKNMPQGDFFRKQDFFILLHIISIDISINTRIARQIKTQCGQ
jgi:hypothetical protein